MEIQKFTSRTFCILRRKKAFPFGTLMLIACCTTVKAFEEKQLQHELVINNAIKPHKPSLQNISFPQFRPWIYGESLDRNALDSRCQNPESEGCILLATKTNIQIKYCTPPHYLEWLHDFLEEQVENNIGYPLINAKSIRLDGACPDFMTYNPGINNIYITYDKLNAQEVGRTASWTITGSPFRKLAYANIAIDDQKIWDFLENNCGGKTNENYRILMEETFLHELWSHGFTLGHNPNGGVTQAIRSCPSSTAKQLTDDETIMLSDYIP